MLKVLFLLSCYRTSPTQGLFLLILIAQSAQLDVCCACAADSPSPKLLQRKLLFALFDINHSPTCALAQSATLIAGGWFHPIHVHLIDFYVLQRFPAGDYQVQCYCYYYTGLNLI
jgi:hypothetical protein